MPFDRADYEDYLARMATASTKDKAVAVHTAAVGAELLTQDPRWDEYLRQIQAKVEQQEAGVEAATNKILDPHLTNQDELMKAKIELAGWISGLEALKWAMRLPQDLIAADKTLDS